MEVQGKPHITQVSDALWLSCLQLETIASGEALNRVVAAYARPTRIVRGKDVDSSWKVNEALFAVPEESTLWDAYKQTASALHPGSNTISHLLTCFTMFGFLQS